MTSVHKEQHNTGRLGWLRAAVLGANDGVVSVSSVVVGVAAANDVTSGTILLAGVAALWPEQPQWPPVNTSRSSLRPTPNTLISPMKLCRLLDLTESAALRVRGLTDRCDVSLMVLYDGYSSQMWGLAFEPGDVVRLAALGASIDVDLYASGPDLL